MANNSDTSNKDSFYEILTNPTLENFRKLLKNNEFETNNLDFKETWIGKEQLVKIMLSMANSGGGLIVIGVTQNKDNTFTPSGIIDFRDQAELHREIKNYLPRHFSYELYSFNYEASEYEKLEHKKFQLLAIKDDPKYLPYICEKDGNTLRNGDVYIRKGTETLKADSEDMVRLIRRNVSSQPKKEKELSLSQHLNQLKTLYDQLEHRETLFKIKTHVLPSMFGKAIAVKEKEYPKESYNQFVANMIIKKKDRIKRELDI